MYEGDSFFTLDPAGRVGLLALTAGLGLAMLALARGLRRGAVAGGLVAVGLFWGFEWLAPQVYYTYYRAIIPGLPAQIVVGAPPGPGAITALLTFSGEASLSAHGRGALGWAMLAAGVWPRRRRKKELSHEP